MGLSDSVEGLFNWMDDAAEAVVPGKREVGKDRSFRPPSDESIECVLSWMDELAQPNSERVVQAHRRERPVKSRRSAKRAQARPAQVQPAPSARARPTKKKPRKPQHAKRTQPAAQPRPQILRELGPPPVHSAVVTGRRPQAGLTESEVWLLGSPPEVALGSDAGRTAGPRAFVPPAPPAVTP
ncbi:MAG: hypothetical protein KDD82_25360, partial [Planctomycetes bacterium]|nr:hypothetical protein [Planctomycetota bacterium]